MNHAETESLLTGELHRIAPEIEVEIVDRNGDLREEFDIDSVDFLNLIASISKKLDIAMPETDYPKMYTFNAMLAYLEEKSIR